MSTFSDAISEYEQNEQWQHTLVYSYFGSAVYFGQVLEQTFSMMLWMKRMFSKNRITKAEAQQIIDDVENSKNTLGRVINEIKDIYSIDPTLEADFEEILTARNYLVHKYFQLEINKFYSDLGRREMLKYFCDFIDKVMDVDSRLWNYYESYVLRMGVTPEKTDQLMREFQEEELQRANKKSEDTAKKS